MSFNRLKYDLCEIKKYNQETTGPGNYIYDPPLISENCFNTNPSIINQKNGVSLNSNTDWRFYSGPIDVESDLLNIARKNSKCPSLKYNPECNKEQCSNQGEPCGAGVKENCSGSNVPHDWNRPGDNNLYNFPNCYFPTEDCRLSNPPTNLRGTGWNRFNPLCHDPQFQVSFPGEILTSTRLVVKDNHRPSVVKPKVNDMNPYEKMTPCPKINSNVCGNFTGSLYQYDVCG
jgi:hypothetical protein